jgi:ABC-type cobalamin/Fe3+-siderophores transport system ATPase subunit
MTFQAAIHAENLRVHYGKRDILNLPLLSVPVGQMAALLGPNGAGKSTFLRCLLGMEHRMQGDVYVQGKRVGSVGAGGIARLRRGIGYVPQQLPAHSEMPLTVREVVAIGRTGIAGLFGPLRGKDWRIVDEWIARLGLCDVSARGFNRISGGQQRKALIAKAMVQQPGLLLLDEPTANLDLGWRERMIEVIEDLYQSAGLTVVLVCHELEVLPPSCQRVIVLQDGTLLEDGPCADVLRDDLITSLYGAGLSVIRNGRRWAVAPGEAVNA